LNELAEFLPVRFNYSVLRYELTGNRNEYDLISYAYGQLRKYAWIFLLSFLIALYILKKLKLLLDEIEIIEIISMQQQHSSFYTLCNNITTLHVLMMMMIIIINKYCCHLLFFHNIYKMPHELFMDDTEKFDATLNASMHAVHPGQLGLFVDFINLLHFVDT